MTLTIEHVMARSDGRFVVNPGGAEVVVSLDPAREDPNAPALLAWLRQNKAAPYQPGLDEVRAAALQDMAAWIERFTGQFTAGVPAAELASWPVKAQAARAHLAGDPQPLIEAEAAITGEPADDLARKVLAKAAMYEAIIARVTGLRRATEAGIQAAGSPEAVRQALDGALAAAGQMIGDLGLSQR